MESLQAYNPALFYVEVVWLSLVSVAGVFGNSMALGAVVTTPSLRTSTQLNITILAAADLVVTAVLVPCRIATEYYSGQWPRHEPWCQVLAYLAIFFIGFSLQQLVFLAQVRYLRVTKSDAVYRRFTSKPAVIGQQVYAVCGTCILALVPLFSNFGSVGYSAKLHFCIFTGRNQQLLAALSMIAALGFIPMFYGLTFLHVRAHRRRIGNWGGLGVGTVLPESTDWRLPSRSIAETDIDTASPQMDALVLSRTAAGRTVKTLAVNTLMLHTNHQDGDKFRPSNSLQDQLGLTDNRDMANDVTTKIPTPENLFAQQPELRVGRPQSINRPVAVPMNAGRKNHRRGPTKESVKITRNLLFIFCGYMCCWLPWCILSLIEPYVDAPPTTHHVLINMLWTNSCINPYLYASMSRNYRNAFKKCMTLKCLFKR